MKKFLDIIKKRWIVNTTKTALLVAIIILVYFIINMGFEKLNIQPIDFTKNKLYTLSDDSKNIIKNIDQNITLYLFGTTEDASTTDFVKQYNYINPKIKIEIVDSNTRQDLVQKYGIQTGADGSSVEETVVIQNDTDTSKDKKISSYEFSSYNTTSGSYEDVTEEKLTNGIVEVTLNEKPKVYFLTGHDEMEDNMTTAKEKIENSLIDVDNIDLLTNDIPEDCKVLIITTPKSDFSSIETAKILNYIQNGGNILWFNDNQTSNLPNVQKVLSSYGVSIDNGVVREQSSNYMLLRSPNFIFPSFASNSRELDGLTEGFVIMLNSTRLNFVSDDELQNLGVTATPILKSSSSSYFRTDLSDTSSSVADGEETGSFALGEKLTKNVGNKKSQLVIYANNTFVSDKTISMQSAYASLSQTFTAINLRNENKGNSTLLINSINDLINREKAVTISKSVDNITYSVTEKEDNIIYGIILGVPVLIVIIGIIIWQVRRRKR